MPSKSAWRSLTHMRTLPSAGANRKAVKRRGQELSYRLRAMSRSKHRGGVQPNLAEQLDSAGGGAEGEEAAAARRQRRGKRRQSRSAALELLTRAQALPVRSASALPEADMAALLGEAGERLSADQAAQAAADAEAAAARSSIADGGSLYDTPAALAYAASRLPACYAALRHALGEVARRRPGWRPSSQLDFGAGPGTAIWAAQQVWPQTPLEATAVEPAAAMAGLGAEIQQLQREQYETAIAAAAAALERRSQRQQRDASAAAAPGTEALREAELEGGAEGDEEAPAVPAPPPRLRWMHKLPPRYRAQQGRRYDLVTAGYVLGELRSDSERRWGRSGVCLCRCWCGGGGGGWCVFVCVCVSVGGGRCSPSMLQESLAGLDERENICWGWSLPALCWAARPGEAA